MSAAPDLGESPEDHGEPRIIEIYAGGHHAGSVAIGRSIRAIDRSNVEIGIFKTVEAARRAVVFASDTSIEKK